MQGEKRVVALALTTLSMTHEGVFLVGLCEDDLDRGTWDQLRLSEVAHLYIKQTENHQLRNVIIEPVLGFERMLVNTSSYTAFGYLSGELLQKYQAWSDARKTGFPAVEEPELPSS